MSWFCVDFVLMFFIAYYFFQLTLKMMLINGCVAWISCIKRSWVLPHLRSQRGMWTYFHFVRLDVPLELKVENLKEIFKVQQVVPASYRRTTLQLVYHTESSYGNSPCLFCCVHVLESYSAASINVNLQFTLFCIPKPNQKSLNEFTRTSGISVHWLLGKFKCLMQSQ